MQESIRTPCRELLPSWNAGDWSIRSVSGRFVTKEEAVLKDLHEELAKKYFEELTEKLRKIGMDDKAIKASVNKWMEEIK